MSLQCRKRVKSGTYLIWLCLTHITIVCYRTCHHLSTKMTYSISIPVIDKIVLHLSTTDRKVRWHLLTSVRAGVAYKDDFVCGIYTNTPTSVADPDPPDPRVLGPPGSGSGSISQRYGSGSGIRILLALSKNSKKNLDFYCFVTYFWLFIFENDVNVPSKSNMRKSFF